jgi:hypothetical protein
MKRVLVVTEKRRYEMPILPGDTKQTAIEWFQDTLDRRDTWLASVTERTYEIEERQAAVEDKEVTP